MDFYRPIRLFKNIWWFLGVNCISGTISSLYYNEYAFFSWGGFVSGALFGFTISATYIYGFTLIWFAMDEKYSWITQTWRRIFFGVLYGELYAIFSFAILAFAYGYIMGGSLSASVETFVYAWKFPALNFIPGVIIVCAVAFFKNWSRSVVNREKLQTEMMTYKFESLQNQLNPHFLFNSFNVLSSLVYDDQKLAVRFIDQLSEIYNYVLESRNKNLVSLKEELAFVDSYCFLLKTRFEEKLEIEIDVESDKNWRVAPMVLQLLIENAVKHNVVTKQNPLIIRVTKSNDYLIVTNTLKPKNVIEKSTNMGLKNIQQRYRYFTDQSVLIDKNDTAFTVSIPVIKKEDEIL